MLFYLALIWCGGAVATAFAITGSTIVGQPMNLRLGLFIVFAWPVSLPWICLRLFRQRRQGPARHGLCGKHWQDHARWELEHSMCSDCNADGVVDRNPTSPERLKEIFGLEADISALVNRELEELNLLFKAHYEGRDAHAFAIAGALLYCSLFQIRAECAMKFPDVETANKVAAMVYMTQVRHVLKTLLDSQEHGEG